MSILKKPYEISVWEDVWNETQGKFAERRLVVIGSHKMVSPGRALEPTLVRNVNGSRSFTFKMYKYYIDPMSGQRVSNPFIQYMVAERKIKLKYGKKIEIINGTEQEVDCWYDFLIKGISEPSASGLYTYTLEDAHIVELSKNGFGLIFDEVMSNNLGTLEELATTALEGTGWTVSTEKFVQKIEEPLVHLVTTTNIYAYRVVDELGTTNGLTADPYVSLIPSGSHILAFYSCCKNKPYRFQFLYKSDNIYHTDDKQIVTDYNCQYYIDYPNMDSSYTIKNTDYNIIIPSGFSLAVNPKFDDENDNVISLLAKGNRFGFTQKSKYSALLDRYLLKYTDQSNQVFWGYDENTIIAPNLITNLVTTPDLSSTTGWVGAYTTNDADYYNKISQYRTQVENVYGKWVGSTFKNVSDLWTEKNFDYDNPDSYHACLKVTFPSLKNIISSGVSISNMLINSGFYDNKNQIKSLSNGDKYIFRIKMRNSDGSYVSTLSGWNVNLKECAYQASSSTYNFNATYGYLTEIGYDNNTGYLTGEYTISIDKAMSEEELQDKQIKLVLTPPHTSTSSTTFYIEALELFRRYNSDSGDYIPLNPTSDSLQAKILTTRYLYADSELFGSNKVATASALTINKTEDLTYNTYTPELYATAEKQRSITIKESNYFNILQTLAETFEAWMDIEITRSPLGAVEGKRVRFKNYVGENNYASFRYGVNLTDVTRQHDSKTIVTKMVVKDNLNEHAENGFCTIKRAGSNQTGENTLYNFDYYVSAGLMDGVALNKYLYQDAVTAGGVKYGYYTRLGILNQLIKTKSETLDSLLTTKIKNEADITVAEEQIKAATNGYEQAAQDFLDLTGKSHTEFDDEEAKKRSDVLNYYTQLATHLKAKQEAQKKLAILQPQQASLKARTEALQNEIDNYQTQKDTLNHNFYTKYYRFIQEGTWVKEDYIDDEKYYVDAQAALYNSCYPRVTYTINVMEISQLPGYEYFTFDLGDITYAEDSELFGEEGRAEVVITELSQNLDNPSKNTIRVQTYKNCFQDLFQKMAATSQQVQYSTGSYHKAERMASADNVLKQEYLKGSLNDMSTLLDSVGEQDVRWGDYGLIVQDLNAKSRQIKMVGGAIMLSKENADGVIEWVTGITTDGIVADLLTAGKVDTSRIQIMAGNEPSFRWDQYGITAYDFSIDNTQSGQIIYGLNPKKFTRFDRFGLYGAEINNTSINGVVYQDGSAWHPNSINEVMANANFALTWEGLIVKQGSSSSATTVRVGKHIVGQKNYLFSATKGSTTLFSIDSLGNATFSGSLSAATGTFSGKLVAAGGTFSGNLIVKKDGKTYFAAYASEDTASGVTSDMVGTATIASFNFNNSSIYSTGKTSFTSTADGLYLGSNGIALGSTFSVSKAGYLIANDGKIGAWNITSDGIFQTSGDNIVAGLYKDGVEDVELGYGKGLTLTQNNPSGAITFTNYELPDSKVIFKINKDVNLTTKSQEKTTRILHLYTTNSVSYTNSINIYYIPKIYNILNKTDSAVLKITMKANGKTISHTFDSEELYAASSSQYNIGYLQFKTDSGTSYYGDIYLELDSFQDYPYIDILTKKRSGTMSSSAQLTAEITLEVYSKEEAILLTNSSVLQVERLIASVGKIGLADITDEGSIVFQNSYINNSNKLTDHVIMSRSGFEYSSSGGGTNSLSEAGFWYHSGCLGSVPSAASYLQSTGFSGGVFSAFDGSSPVWDERGSQYYSTGAAIEIRRMSASSSGTYTTGQIKSGWCKRSIGQGWPAGECYAHGTVAYIEFEAESNSTGHSDIIFSFKRTGVNEYVKIKLSEIAAALGK